MYKVFGFTDDCHNFEVVFESFVNAVKSYRGFSSTCTVFISRDSPCSCLFVK